MNKTLFGVIAFAAGAAIGSVVTWKVVKTKYEQIAEEEIQSVKDELLGQREEYTNLMVKMKKHLNESATYDGPQDADEAAREENADEYYPDDDGRDFTEKEKQQIKYYKLTSKYRGGNNEADNEDGDNENDKEGDVEEEEFDGEVRFINGPYPISPDDFSCSPPGYSAQPLDYFADGVLADDWGMPVDIEETIGEENLAHFGEYADDILYVRNERTEIDYEVTKDPRTYEEVRRMNPNPYYGKYEN